MLLPGQSPPPRPDHETLDGLTERRVQHMLFKRFMAGGSHQIAVPNSTLYGWEADMLTVTKAGFVHEYEIKVSRADLLRELKAVREAHEAGRDHWTSRSTKCWRHSVLAGLLEPPPLYSGQRAKEWHERAMMRRPNHFWFVVREGICQPEEIPAYAGLLVVRESVHYRGGPLVLHEVRKAKRLHPGKIDMNHVMRLAGHACYRFWDHVFPKQEAARA